MYKFLIWDNRVFILSLLELMWCCVLLLDSNEGRWQLVKRFFLYENISSNTGQLRIATSMQLVWAVCNTILGIYSISVYLYFCLFSVRLNSDGNIFLPYLRIHYDVVDDDAAGVSIMWSHLLCVMWLWILFAGVLWCSVCTRSTAVWSWHGCESTLLCVA